MVKISIVGLGYVGLVHAVGFALLGHEVIGYDVDEQKLKRLSEGTPTIYEEGLEEGLRRALSHGSLRFTRDIGEAVRGSDVSFISVGTPSNPDGSQDLSQIIAASRSLGRALRGKGSWHLIAVKSTVLPGTTLGVVRRALEEESGLKAFEDFGLASNPEFLREGSAMRDFFKPDRIVIGVGEAKSKELLLDVYAPIEAPKVVTEITTAEMVKYAANAFLALRISFANEMGSLCKELGIDCYEVLKIVGMDHRIGPHFFRAGLGFGGSCFPKDLRALAAFAESRGLRARIVRATLEVNEEQIHRALALLEKHLIDLRGKKVGVLGLAFKPGTDDVRESRGIAVAKELLRRGALVGVHDPKAMENARRELGEAVTYYGDPQSLVRDSEAVVIATEWREYELLDYRGKVVVDGRRVEKAREARVYEGMAW
ncbi:MAG: UDP-glucose/GDP-mannose dehydrogenase family protein [Acidilobaceae archaeon]|nr:UDP-glucose/GDP-mannose dehydrogenase family protein [Acidilobaceae archaeon]MCX8165771.1 UDP-glucose/GDP-mannose dehydrogenase family protein [Acidilobaceae archaeon]MDW7974196.1 UDP-glucose/GDP-mannose dehydrogenase family protein [Sulfolobales archaeon]